MQKRIRFGKTTCYLNRSNTFTEVHVENINIGFIQGIGRNKELPGDKEYRFVSNVDLPKQIALFSEKENFDSIRELKQALKNFYDRARAV